MSIKNPRKWYLTPATVQTNKGPCQIVVAVGPVPGEHERIEVTETGDASGGVWEHPEPIKIVRKGPK